MIIIRMQGGMGNQMFMYTFARSLQRKTKEKIYISTYQYRHMKDNLTPRAYALGVFKMKDSVLILPKGIDNIMEWVYRVKHFIFQLKYPAIIVDDEKSFIKATKCGLFLSGDMYRFYRHFSKKAAVKFVDGLFMSWKYFDKYSDDIKEGFKIIENASEENINLREEIEKENAVCMHVRLGDYLSKEFIRSNYICKEDYYLKAMDVIAQEQKNVVFYVFSTSKEDIQYIKENFQFRYPVRYVELNNPDYEEIRLMASCKHFILSNSSFSWWAQYLCKNNEKIVVAPSRWINNKKQYTMDLYMDEWKIVDV